MTGPLRGVLLDFGGTLDSDGLHWSTQFALAFAAAGLDLPRASLDQAFLAADRALDQLPGVEALGFRAHLEEQARLMLHGLELAPALAPRVADAFAERARPHLARAAEQIEARRGHLRFGLVSNFTGNLPLILEETGLGPLFDGVTCSALVGCCKPAASIFRVALEAAGLEAGETAMVGDSLPSDIVPARQLGLTTLWLRGDRVYGGASVDERAADFVVTSLAEALRICDGRTED